MPGLNRRPRRRKPKREYARIPIIIHGIVRVPVPPGLTASEVEKAARESGHLIFDAEGFVDSVRLVVDAAVLQTLKNEDADPALATVGS